MAENGRKLSAQTVFDQLPKNFSYEENYHQLYYYPKVILERIRQRYGSSKISGGGGLSLSDSLPSLEQIASCSLDSSAGDDVMGTWDHIPTAHNPHGRSILRRTSGSHENLHGLHMYQQASGIAPYLGDANTSDRGSSSLASSSEKGSREDCVSRDSVHSKDGSASSTGHSSDIDMIMLKPISRQRSSSLKSLASSGERTRKKSVRFADVLGLDLQTVKHIINKDLPPVLPRSALEDLRKGIEEAHKTEGTRYVCLCFTLPGDHSDFLERVQRDKVALERCIVGARDSTLTGTIRVVNLCHRKEVTLRYTINNWVTFDDINASYVLHSNDGATDRFSFTLILPRSMNVGARLSFAIKYRAVDINQTYWDNNFEDNYQVECYAKSVPTRESDSAWMHFL